jgi:hypothetical protein
VISPVIPTSADTVRPVTSETIAVAIVTPAEGPSFGHRSGGHVDVDVVLGEPLGIDPEPLRVAAHPGERGVRGLLHHVAELAGDLQPPLPG